MSNREKYRHAMNTVIPSKEITAEVILELREEKKMKTGTHRMRRTLVGLVAAVVLVIGVTGGAYATDALGFRQAVNTWLYGEPVQVEVEEISPGNYEVHYPNGMTRGMGGISYDANGNPQPATAEDINSQLDYPEVEMTEDGTINLFYRDQVIDITEDVADDNVAQVKFKEGVLPLYVTINWEGDAGYSVHTSHFGF
ncbi:MAG: hypothetical protein IKR02_00545 [Firmicutes bacterium]|nr:hypothetical protein [Bacillota bacterium]